MTRLETLLSTLSALLDFPPSLLDAKVDSRREKTNESSSIRAVSLAIVVLLIDTLFTNISKVVCLDHFFGLWVSFLKTSVLQVFFFFSFTFFLLFQYGDFLSHITLSNNQ
ncbi:hypothetical protein ACQKWADRAFT_278817 [Trichoderma austrokoningii]